MAVSCHMLEHTNWGTFQERTVFEGILDKFIRKFRFFTFDEKTNERLKEPNYFTAPFVAAHLKWYAF